MQRVAVYVLLILCTMCAAWAYLYKNASTVTIQTPAASATQASNIALARLASAGYIDRARVKSTVQESIQAIKVGPVSTLSSTCGADIQDGPVDEDISAINAAVEEVNKYVR